MRIRAEPAFVLHARRWRERSLLVEVLSLNFGRLGLVAHGIHSVRRHALRAALQPLQHISFDAVLRGELATLNQAEALDTLPRLTGPALLSGFYVNELILRLVARQDPHPGLYAAYLQVRARLGTDNPLGWSLRRFERDLLQALGLGLDYAVDGDGLAINPAARYQLDPEHGARRVPQHAAADNLSGHALNALACDVMPNAADLADLRRALRRVLAHHLGPQRLKSWELMRGLTQVVPITSARAR